MRRLPPSDARQDQAGIPKSMPKTAADQNQNESCNPAAERREKEYTKPGARSHYRPDCGHQFDVACSQGSQQEERSIDGERQAEAFQRTPHTQRPEAEYDSENHPWQSHPVGNEPPAIIVHGARDYNQTQQELRGVGRRWHSDLFLEYSRRS